MNKVKVKCGAIVKEVPKGSLKWYKEAGWKILEDKKPNEVEDDKTNTEKTITT